MSEAALVQVLRLAARLESDDAHDRRLSEAAARVNDWTGLAALADAHGLVPLVVRHFDRAGITLPDDVRQALIGMALAVRAANRVHFRVLRDVLDAFEAAAIPVLVLKGAALAHVLYAAPDFRPLRDIDLLVRADVAASAQRVLGSLGFSALLPADVRRVGVHHHLPAATRVEHGHTTCVEIHTDALTRDTPGSLTFEALSAAPRAFDLGGRTAYTLGHADMLYHLCRHTAEPAPLLRLVWVADVLGYATRYCEEVHWEELRVRFPMVVNALSLLDLVTPMPSKLVRHVPPASIRRVTGVGVASRTPGAMFEGKRSLRDVLRDVFNPSDWWLQLYYGTGGHASLMWYRLIRHPAQVAYWLARRALRSSPRRRRARRIISFTKADRPSRT